MPAKCSWLFHSDTGEGKTSWVEQMALHVYNVSGKKSRLTSMDGGGVAHLSSVGMGVLDVWVISQEAKIETINLASMGYWPLDRDDPKSKLVAPGPSNKVEEVGVWGFESLASMGQAELEELTQMRADGKTGAGMGGSTFTSGTTKFATPGQDFYGTVQGKMKKAVVQTQLLSIEHSVWTTRTLKAVDEGRTDPCYGPMLIGKAATPDIPGWFVHTIHLDSEEVTTPSKMGVGVKVKERRAYLDKHYGVNNPTIPYFANLRVSPMVSNLKPLYLVTDFNKTNTVKELFDLIAVLQAKAQIIILGNQGVK